MWRKISCKIVIVTLNSYWAQVKKHITKSDVIMILVDISLSIEHQFEKCGGVHCLFQTLYLL